MPPPASQNARWSVGSVPATPRGCAPKQSYWGLSTPIGRTQLPRPLALLHRPAWPALLCAILPSEGCLGSFHAAPVIWLSYPFPCRLARGALHGRYPRLDERTKLFGHSMCVAKENECDGAIFCYAALSPWEPQVIGNRAANQRCPCISDPLSR
jgi:hypothetical protein